ncbi:MAG: methionine adenosyltransferase [Methanosarcinales archaeon]|nr:methionine adenosyltransferase [Methanosarcinales archaeon]
MIIVDGYARPPFEVVERKGLGHPDSLADGISESISRHLCRIYREDFGEIVHHNLDKVLIIGGCSAPKFGGGSILKPPAVVVGGRATVPRGQSLEDVIVAAASEHIQGTMRYLRDYSIEPRAREGSPELRSLIGKGANDTSIGVGYAPLSPVEQKVLELEKVVRGVRGAGDDVKIMAVRNQDHLRIVVACAMVDRFMGSLEEYQEAKARIKEAVSARADDAQVFVNAADQGNNIFLTVTGSSVEMGDDGATGRGNRGNGLITPMRPMSIEAIAGKNPVSHVGKIYNVMAQGAAYDLSLLEGVAEAYVTLVSKIGAPLEEPLLKGVRLTGEGLNRSLEPEVNSILEDWLGRTERLVDDFVAGRLGVY